MTKTLSPNESLHFFLQRYYYYALLAQPLLQQQNQSHLKKFLPKKAYIMNMLTNMVLWAATVIVCG